MLTQKEKITLVLLTSITFISLVMIIYFSTHCDDQKDNYINKSNIYVLQVSGDIQENF